jgi:hypothetical protein
VEPRDHTPLQHNMLQRLFLFLLESYERMKKEHCLCFVISDRT